MFAKLLAKLSPRKRDELFDRIQQLVREIDAADRSLESIDEGIAVDEVLEEIAAELDAELTLTRSRRLRRCRPLVLQDGSEDLVECAYDESAI